MLSKDTIKRIAFNNADRDAVKRPRRIRAELAEAPEQTGLLVMPARRLGYCREPGDWVVYFLREKGTT